MATKNVKKANQTRAQKAKENHARASTERANDIQTVRSAFLSGNWDIIFPNLIEKITGFQKYHIKIAQDGVGARATGFKLTDGSPEVENVYLTSSQRASHLDKAAGLEELLDYITRMTTKPIEPVSTKVATPKETK